MASLEINYKRCIFYKVITWSMNIRVQGRLPANSPIQRDHRLLQSDLGSGVVWQRMVETLPEKQ